MAMQLALPSRETQTSTVSQSPPRLMMRGMAEEELLFQSVFISVKPSVHVFNKALHKIWNVPPRMALIFAQ